MLRRMFQVLTPDPRCTPRFGITITAVHIPVCPLRPSSQATALVYFKRFYTVHSCMEYDAARIAPACVYLAGKVCRQQPDQGCSWCDGMATVWRRSWVVKLLCVGLLQLTPPG
jgi:Cyclin, N-terminal domain